MNKDVIYIEPEDDITDIIAKIENSKEKIVALVPPKKAGVFRSVVNIKLISKVGTTSEKTVVLVTTDPSIVKLAAATRLPVTKNLQTAPTIPTLDEALEESADITDVVEVDDEDDVVDDEKIAEEAAKNTKNEEAEPEKEDSSNNEPEEEAPKKKEKKATVKKKSGKGPIDWIKNHKKLSIAGGVFAVVLILFLVWAFTIAPAVTITVGIQTEQKPFSESVSFTTNQADENAKEGKFYLTENKIEDIKEVKFEATGKKNVGEKATGDVVVYTYFKEKGAVAINAGSSFTISGLTYYSNNNATLSWDGDDDDACDNAGQTSSLVRSGCQISTRISVTAAEPGIKYNIAASNSGWNTLASVGVYSDKAMSGGTDKEITVVQQSDVEKAKSELATANESENKEKLLEGLSDDVFAIDASFSQTTSEATSSPAVGEEVGEGTTPTLKATTVTAIYTIDKAKIEEFINEKASVGEDKKIYEIKNPYIENFSKSGETYVGRLKASYSKGPKITENEVTDMAKGKGIGEIQHDLKSIDGIIEVKTETSFPWVTSVPSDTNKITVHMEVKDRDSDKQQKDSDSEEKKGEE